jgi:hypothetical protein
MAKQFGADDAELVGFEASATTTTTTAARD